MMFLRKNQKGFTLIEVMLVVIIIGIIAIIALPKLMVTRKTAAEKSCLSNLQALGTAVEQYKWNGLTGEFPTNLDNGIGTAAGNVVELVEFLTAQGYLPADSSMSGVCPDSTGVLTYDPFVSGVTPVPVTDGNINCNLHALP